ncbi:AAEL017347-PA [Aedes aegypti]|uniref:AAEL017347-PA n=2 Tax=Aedes aegypti TaxID=7159 RepID=A0A1S7UEH0_AEDAE|nr:AAEL017347-PA [Aedes aegypti]DAA80419.1 TPA_exp: odorant receptor 87 [Aedes aegypti]
MKKFIWHDEAGDDYFRLLDYVAVFAGTRFVPKNHNQKRMLPFWKVYRWMCYYHSIYLIMNAFAHLDRRNNFSEFSWFVMIALEVVMGHVKDLIVARNSEKIQDAQNFINKRMTIVSDEVFEPGTRKTFFRKVQIMCGATGMVALNMILMMTIPNKQIDELFALPSWIAFSSVLSYIFKFTISPPWPCKIICGTVLLTSILEGFKTELLVFANDLGNTVDRARPTVFQQFPDSETYQRKDSEEVVFKNLQQHIPQKIMRHIELLEKIQDFKPLVELFFFVLYFHAMALIGTYIFVILQTDFSIGSAMILMALTAYFAKCYFWCWVISSFQEVNELIALNIMQLITAIPHPAEHHLKYIELRTMLMIMMIRTQSSAQFSCGGLSIISVELFGNLLNVSYSVITFLLNII